ncbi:c-type cytochrome [Pseudaminobacter sp. NGMCC 1.201702]|uniref:c-type cytochrome n=1 Tax=Pseudaminobacter sp. NGMCC 1.201702 TaxID=3391825 RepID=UPI0039EEA412
MIKSRIVVVAGLVAAAGIFTGYAVNSGNSAGLLQPEDASLVARGEAVYAQQCASCHGADLEGQPDWQTRDAEGFLPAPPHDESGHTWHHPDKLLFDITKLGVAEAANLNGYQTRMPAFGELMSDEDILAVLSYIKSRWPQEIQKRHDELNRAFERSNGVAE